MERPLSPLPLPTPRREREQETQEISAMVGVSRCAARGGAATIQFTRLRSELDFTESNQPGSPALDEKSAQQTKRNPRGDCAGTLRRSDPVPGGGATGL